MNVYSSSQNKRLCSHSGVTHCVAHGQQHKDAQINVLAVKLALVLIHLLLVLVFSWELV